MANTKTVTRHLSQNQSSTVMTTCLQYSHNGGEPTFLIKEGTFENSQPQWIQLEIHPPEDEEHPSNIDIRLGPRALWTIRATRAGSGMATSFSKAPEAQPKFITVIPDEKMDSKWFLSNKRSSKVK
ncbi:uncharacterized protein DS421_19g652130 [Arachis hypogaea]|uniref:Uncharacterized protein n=1 Tax=Arachis hypogaea TaxID=3818 RepID=A0A6B9V7R9_ARAHY|nr:uncharacterized protein DS421_19g652130 [Arachis hypogaea]